MNAFTIALLIVILIILIIFLAYRKVIKITFTALTLIFFVSLAGVLSSVFVPKFYQNISERIFRDNIFAVQLEYFDNTLTDFSKVPNDLKQKIENVFRKNKKDIKDEKFETQIYEQFIVLMGNILRFFIFSISFIGLITTTYLRYAFAGVSESIKLKKEIDDLKSRLNALENKTIL